MKRACSMVFVFAIAVVQPVIGLTENTVQIQKGFFSVLEGEILDVEESKEPEGSAILVIRDDFSGKTQRFLADPYRSTIQVRGVIKSISDVLGGSKATMIYQDGRSGKAPEVVYLKVMDTYQT
jgi:hypothetical protein